MAESNITLNTGAGGSDVATMTDGSGYHHQKVVIGFDGGTSPTPVDGSNPLPVTGTVDLGATDNAVLDSIAAATAATQAAVEGTLTVGSHAVTNAGTFAVQVTSLPASTNTVEVVGDAAHDAAAAGNPVLVGAYASSSAPTAVSANGDAVRLWATTAGALNIADGGGAITVDGTVAATQSGTWAVTGAAAEDAAASGNPVLIGGRYDSSARTLETGDVGAIALNASGQVLVEIAAGAGSGGTAAADDADFTAGTTSGTPVMGVYESSPTSVTDGDLGTVGLTQTRAMKVYVTGVQGSQTDDAAFTPGTSLVSVVGAEFDDTTPDSVDEGDAGALRMSANRNLYTTLRDAAGNERGANVNASNALLVAQTGALPAGTNNIGDVDILSIAAGDNNIGNVDIVTMPNVTLAAGTNTNEVVGDVAHDAAAAGNPVQIGGYATNNIEGVTQVAAGDLTRQVHDLNGVQVMRPHTTLEEIQTVRTTNTDGNSTSLITAAGAGVHNYVTHVTIWNSSSTDGFVDFRDGTGGSVIHTFPAPQTGGCTVAFNPPLKFGDNTAVAYDVSGAITTIYISAVYFQAQG